MKNRINKDWLGIVGIIVGITGIALTFCISLFPTTFAAMGTTLAANLKWLILTYFTWTNISTLIIITLLVVILRLLIQQKNDPSPR